jgi:YVTN family beta-propeller protein
MLTDGTRRRQIQIAIGALLALAGMITLVMFVATNRSPSGSTPAPPAAPTAGPEVAIPALGATIPVRKTPGFVVVSPNGRHAYIANQDTQLITVLDTAVNKVTATIPIPAGTPQFLALSPDGRTLYVTIYNDQRTIHVIDTATLKVVATIPVEKNPRDIIWAPDGRFAYVVNEGSNTVSVIDARTNQVTATLPTGEGPSNIAVLPNGRQAYVSNLDSGTLTVLELTG